MAQVCLRVNIWTFHIYASPIAEDLLYVRPTATTPRWTRECPGHIIIWHGLGWKQASVTAARHLSINFRRGKIDRNSILTKTRKWALLFTLIKYIIYCFLILPGSLFTSYRLIISSSCIRKRKSCSHISIFPAKQEFHSSLYCSFISLCLVNSKDATGERK